MTTPACRHEDIVRPEQSNVSGPAPPDVRLPICDIAARTATAAWSDDGMDGRRRKSGRAGELEGLGELEDLAAALASVAPFAAAIADRTAAARSRAAFAACYAVGLGDLAEELLLGREAIVQGVALLRQDSLIDFAWASWRESPPAPPSPAGPRSGARSWMPDCQSLTWEISSIFLLKSSRFFFDDRERRRPGWERRPVDTPPPGQRRPSAAPEIGLCLCAWFSDPDLLCTFWRWILAWLYCSSSGDLGRQLVDLGLEHPSAGGRSGGSHGAEGSPMTSRPSRAEAGEGTEGGGRTAGVVGLACGDML